MTSSARSHEVRTLVVSDGAGSQLQPTTMEDLGWQERRNLQPWIRDHPTPLEPDLLLISEEFADWEGAGDPVRDRLDLLFLDGDGHLLVVELKRGKAPDRTESQALLYAAFCDQLTTSDVVDQFAATHDLDRDLARQRVLEHASVLSGESPGRVRVRLVAEEFPPSVTASVLFLREIGSGGPEASQLDIGCIKLTAYVLPDGSHLIAAQPVIPIPETEEYQVRKRRRSAADDSAREERSRIENAIPALQRRSAIEPGTPLRLNLDWLSPRERPSLERLLETEPNWATISWTGEEVATRAILREGGDEPESLNGYYQALRAAAGLGTSPGATGAWLVGDTHQTIREYADAVLAAETSGER